MTIKNTWSYQIVRKCYYALKDWDKTIAIMNSKYQIKPYKNIHKGQICVVVGNGPSLRVSDLTKLYDLGIPTFACNRIHLAFSQTPWRPTYYFSSDPRIVNTFSGELDGVPEKHRFYPRKYIDTIKHGVFYNNLEFMYEQEGKFSLDASRGVYAAATVTTEMLQFAYYMGFQEIYLIGVDFNYAMTEKTGEGEYIYQGENNYFIKGYLQPGEIAATPNVRANLLGFCAAKDAIEGQGRVIKNATRGGKLEVFERANLDELFKMWEEKLK